MGRLGEAAGLALGAFPVFAPGATAGAPPPPLPALEASRTRGGDEGVFRSGALAAVVEGLAGFLAVGFLAVGFLAAGFLTAGFVAAGFLTAGFVAEDPPAPGCSAGTFTAAGGRRAEARREAPFEAGCEGPTPSAAGPLSEAESSPGVLRAKAGRSSGSNRPTVTPSMKQARPKTIRATTPMTSCPDVSSAVYLS